MANDLAGFSHLPIREEWLRGTAETALLADVPVIDCHHHLWDRPTGTYLFPELRGDVATGHKVLATVYVQCRSMYRRDGPEHFRPLGEVEFANGVAAMAASGQYGDTRACAAIVACVDMTLGRDVAPVLDAMRRSTDRLRGIRYPVAFHDDPAVRSSPVLPPAGLLRTSAFREAAGCLAARHLTLDIWAYHTQLDEIYDLAASTPELMIIVDHCGGPIGVGPYRGQREQVFGAWGEAMSRLAALPNVAIKLGGLAMPVGGFDLQLRHEAPSSAHLDEIWSPYFDACIDLFGADRCMFESNFPVDKGMVSYVNCWNAFKRIAARRPQAERDKLLFATAARLYRIPLATDSETPHIS